ncbi:MAG TPA: amidohydrolase family protein [Candidatus Limnocylindrales bacterium]
MTTVDSHHHFWDPARADYPWMTDELAPIRRAYGPDDLRPLLAAAGIDRSILVQTRSSTEETAEFLAITASEPFVAGVVGWLDLTGPDPAEEIAALRALPGGHRLAGIRHQVHDEPDPEWLARSDVRHGIRAVTDAGLVYDLLVRSRELPAALDVARSVPDGRFVVDHIAKPAIASGEIEPWASLLRPFRELENVACKISGMVTEANWASWQTRDLRPYVDVVLETFGPRRVLFGSDWPVCLLAASYERVVATARELLEALSESERDAAFGGNAIEVYRLAAP